MVITTVLIFIVLLQLITTKTPIEWMNARQCFHKSGALEKGCIDLSYQQQYYPCYSEDYQTTNENKLFILQSITINNFSKFEGFSTEIIQNSAAPSGPCLWSESIIQGNYLSYHVITLTYPRIEGFVANLQVQQIFTITREKKIVDVLVFIQDMPKVKLQQQGPITFDFQKTIKKVSDYQYEVSFTSTCIIEINLTILITYNPNEGHISDALYTYKIIKDKSTVNSFFLKDLISPEVQPIVGINNFMLTYEKSDGVQLLLQLLPPDQIIKVIGPLQPPSDYKNPINQMNALVLQLQQGYCNNGSPTISVTSSFEASCDNEICSQISRSYFSLYTLSYQQICYSCNPNCEMCEDSLHPNKCSKCAENKYLNPNSQSCENETPLQTVCIQQKINMAGKLFFVCEKCDSSCEYCSEPQNPKTCLSCIQDSALKYFYNKQCFETQPNNTFCDKNNVCNDCHPNCSSCQDFSDFCLKCKVNKFFYQNKCLDSKPVQAYCVYRYH